MLQNVAGEFVRGMPTDCLEIIEPLVREERVSAGTCLFAEGSRHPNFHVLLEGHVRLEMTVAGRGRIPLLTVGPGDVLAWSALLSQGTMTATAVALDSVRLATLPGDQLRQLCEARPALGYHLMKQMSVALSRRLLATRLQLLDLFAEHEPAVKTRATGSAQVDSEC